MDVGTSHTSVGTTAVTVLSSDHGRLRRAQRLIEKRDLQAAKRNSTPVASYHQRGELNWKYTFADIVYITDSTKTREITSWAIPGAGLDVPKRRITNETELAHKAARQRNKARLDSWTSHTVIVVDQSGSMRRTDMAGGATRSDAVWLMLALDFVAKHLVSGQSTDSDVVSVVSMNASGVVLIDRMPHDWKLFNYVIDLLRSQEPSFEGNYIPALDKAEELLCLNMSGSCALTLFFLSDGRPSDPPPPRTDTGDPNWSAGPMSERIDRVCSRFGRRLSIVAVGFGGLGEDFSVLQTLAKRPIQFGSSGHFHAATLDAEALSQAFSSLTSSLNMTRTELSREGGSALRSVRDVQREARDSVEDLGLTQAWLVYNGMLNGWTPMIRRAWSTARKDWVCLPPLAPGAVSVALKKAYFGEGAERLVRKFREVDAEGEFVGPALVAKEGRFMEDLVPGQGQMVYSFHRRFCDTQARAQKLAEVFNEKLTKLPSFIPGVTPTIAFLECAVYVVRDVNMGEVGVLVEKQLDPRAYKKWNDNAGFVDGQDAMAEQLPGAKTALGIIEESDDEETDNSEESSESEHATRADPDISVADIPQAFSHFTYRYTKRRLLVCDVQGVLSVSDSGSSKFEFTDPVIHFCSRTGQRSVFGQRAAQRLRSEAKRAFLTSLGVTNAAHCAA